MLKSFAISSKNTSVVATIIKIGTNVKLDQNVLKKQKETLLDEVDP